MHLMHNQAFKLTTEALGLPEGIFRIVVDVPVTDITYCVLIKQNSPRAMVRGGRPRIEDQNLKRKKRIIQKSLVGTLYAIARNDLMDLIESHEAIPISLELPGLYYQTIDQPAAQNAFEKRCRVMEQFLDIQKLKESILAHGNLGSLVREATQQHKVSRSYVYKLWSMLCTLGLSKTSLRTRWDKCGAPGERRDLSITNPRKKAGRKTFAQRLSKLVFGCWGEPIQPGMNTVWRAKIMLADKGIATPKPSMPERHKRIISSHFTTAMRFDDKGNIVAIGLEKGQYPNYQQVKRVLTEEIDEIYRIREKTSSGHFERALRGLSGYSWEGAEGPGLMYAIDSTIGDVYLRSSIDPTWIIGRPIVYVIVDVFSTAVVGFYVCLTGPSWDTAQVAIFNTAASSELLSDLWGYDMRQSLFPAPTLPARLLCDRGEYLSKRAKATGMALLTTLSYTAPFRPDLKGVVEVMHRIMKNVQYNFIPGAMDARRKEYDLRKSNPAAATMSIRQYMQFLHECFYVYNLTADRSIRLDAHMIAQGVFPSPAGLWRWGHAMGIGFSRAQRQAELITQLLPGSVARVTRHGVIFRGNQYSSSIVESEQWTTRARSVRGSSEISAMYYPGSVSHIWTPYERGNGLIDLTISDHSRADPALTYDEVVDAFAFQKLKAADVEHKRVQEAVLGYCRMELIRKQALEETRIARQRSRGLTPTIREARAFENDLNTQLSVGEVRGTAKTRSESTSNYDAMMHDLYQAMDAEAAHD
ncbi:MULTISPECIES: DDE-type integrase/transposase/recombinase [unclassified Delftia]|uniref:DDE-type integrase/transposase/recombinase n=1 Tax=unclassified Delftia TaxID=2613839 RepID=UPI001900BF30|nr:MULTISPECIES: DDE-type integrase/transposase/recombinase [unclassified Delftia]MBK0114091.1 DDE-type integrase/transposase/recombinase [Delftia sp. S65]MBK0117899.1 DDE-type integrase/transposase/recombinase [Delftia sp. S67]MBK0129102.1 DDE-type integrase/transposase/recombinase [Delftia sp. S66]